MSCFHKNHFRLKDGKEELNSFWFVAGFCPILCKTLTIGLLFHKQN